MSQYIMSHGSTNSYPGCFAVACFLGWSDICKPEPIMLSVLPIIPSRISHKLYPLFLFYSHAIT